MAKPSRQRKKTKGRRVRHRPDRVGSWSATLAEVAAELGKDQEPPCAACGHRGRGRRRLVHLTNAVSLWLCEVHAADDYMRRDGGWTFAQRIAGAWAAAGVLSARRVAALRAHVQQIGRAGGRDLPGSYAWPELRGEAEGRFARGDDPMLVIVELRGRYAGGPFRPPSVRTMRRWFTDARWVVRRDMPCGRSGPGGRTGPGSPGSSSSFPSRCSTCCRCSTRSGLAPPDPPKRRSARSLGFAP